MKVGMATRNLFWMTAQTMERWDDGMKTETGNKLNDETSHDDQKTKERRADTGKLPRRRRSNCGIG